MTNEQFRQRAETPLRLLRTAEEQLERLLDETERDSGVSRAEWEKVSKAWQQTWAAVKLLEEGENATW